MDFDVKAFGEVGEEDTTGVCLWSAALILGQWILDMPTENFTGKTVCELGAGCGLPGLVVHRCTAAHRVVLTDCFPSTLDNLHQNAELNMVEACAECGVTSIDLLLCSSCQTRSYCSPACQKAAWNGHKVECKAWAALHSDPADLAVQSLDWANVASFKETFDIVLGSDLVYHESIVQILVQALCTLVKPGGVFYHVASQQRDSLVEFKEAMETVGFYCEMSMVPEAYKRNPIQERSVDFFQLHFSEMEDVYCLYTFTKLQ